MLISHEEQMVIEVLNFIASFTPVVADQISKNSLLFSMNIPGVTVKINGKEIV